MIRRGDREVAAVRRPGARADDRLAHAPGPPDRRPRARHPRARARRGARPAPPARGRPDARRSATRCSTSARSPGSATCGRSRAASPAGDRPVAAGRRGLRRGGAGDRRARRARGCRSPRRRHAGPLQGHLRQGGAAVPALRRASSDPGARPVRRQPPDVLVPESASAEAHRPQGRRPHRARQHAGELRRRARARRRHDRVRRAARGHRRPRARRSCGSRTTTRTTSRARRRSRRASPTSPARRSRTIELDVDLKLPGYEARVVEALRAHGLRRAHARLDAVHAQPRAAARARAGAAARLVGAARQARLHALAAVRRARLRVPALRAAAGCRRSPPGHIAAGRCDAVMCHFQLVTPALLEAVRDAGGELYVWTVDDARRIRSLEALGVTGRDHQRPAAVRRVRRSSRWRPSSPRGRRPPWSGGRPPVISAARPTTRPSRRHRKRTTPRKVIGFAGGSNSKLQPDSIARPARALERAPARVGAGHVAPAVAVAELHAEAHPPRRRRAGPGIEARMPTAFGCLAVSQTLTVAHRRSADPPCARTRARAPRGRRTSGETRCEKSAHTGKTVAARREL